MNSIVHEGVQQIMSCDAKKIVITSEQLRAARGLLRLSAERLAEISGVSLVTIRRAEAVDGAAKLIPANAEVLRNTLEAAGIQFIPEDEAGGAGVRYKAKAL